MFVLGLKMKKLLLVGTITLSMLCTESMMDDHTVEAKVKSRTSTEKCNHNGYGRNEFFSNYISSLV